MNVAKLSATNCKPVNDALHDVTNKLSHNNDKARAWVDERFNFVTWLHVQTTLLDHFKLQSIAIRIGGLNNTYFQHRAELCERLQVMIVDDERPKRIVETAA